MYVKLPYGSPETAEVAANSYVTVALASDGRVAANKETSPEQIAALRLFFIFTPISLAKLLGKC